MPNFLFHLPTCLHKPFYSPTCSCFDSCCDVCVCLWSLIETWPVSFSRDSSIASAIFFCPSYDYGVVFSETYISINRLYIINVIILNVKIVTFLWSVTSTCFSSWRISSLCDVVSRPCLPTAFRGPYPTAPAPRIRSGISESPSSSPVLRRIGSLSGK